MPMVGSPCPVGQELKIGHNVHRQACSDLLPEVSRTSKIESLAGDQDFINISPWDTVCVYKNLILKSWQLEGVG